MCKKIDLKYLKLTLSYIYTVECAVSLHSDTNNIISHHYVSHNQYVPLVLITRLPCINCVVC